VALVLAGGGARGYAHIPALELIEELGIPVDMVIGTSAGAIIGGLYSAGYSPAMLRELLFDLDWTGIFQDRPVSPLERELGSRSLDANPLNIQLNQNFSLELGKGLSTGQEAYKLFKGLTARIPSYMDFDDLPIPFRAATVELLTGNLHIIESGDLAEAIRASMSIPGVFEPLLIDGKYYVDGGVMNNMPVSVAKDLGFDIIIAVDLFDPYVPGEDTFSRSPLEVIEQVLYLHFYSVTESQYEYADVVVVPRVESYSIMDFPRAREIYDQSQSDMAQFREPLEALRRRIYPEPDATGILPDATGSLPGETGFLPGEATGLGPDPAAPTVPPQAVYAALPDIIPEALNITGAFAQDGPYIRAAFSRLIAGKPLGRENLSRFLDLIYQTGNYLNALARTDMRSGVPVLELLLNPLEAKTTHLMMNAVVQDTIAADLSAKFALLFEAQFRGITGPGSVLSFGVSGINTISANVLFLQPLTQNVYLRTNLNLSQDQDLTGPGFSWNAQGGSTFLSAEGKFSVEVNFGRMGSLVSGASYFTADLIRGPTDYLTFAWENYGHADASVVTLFVDYCYDRRNYALFPTTGLYTELNNTLYFPVSPGEYIPYNILSARIAAALPLDDTLSVILDGFAGADVTGNLRRLPGHIPLTGFSNDRLFFPQIAGRQHFGVFKASAAGMLQYQPWKNRQVLGGEWFFSAGGGLGMILPDLTEAAVTAERILHWYVSLNAGLRLTPVFGLRVRAGVGGWSRDRISPFLTLDFGYFHF
jgi:NTE family protein